MLLAAAGCGRAPPAPTAVSTAPEPDAAAPELAGGPPPSSAPAPSAPLAAGAEPSPAAEAAASDASASVQALAPAAAAPAVEAALRPAAEMPDPLQRLNRPLFNVDQALRHTALARRSASLPPKPPKPVRQGLANLFSNMDEPTTLANQVLQRRPGSAVRTVARFVINSTLGVAGVFDVAQRFGLRRSHADFGQTLASYGVGPGAYLYVPVRGPTNLRDVVGAVADSYFWPLHWVHLAWFAAPAVTVARLEAEPRHDEGFRYAAAKPQPDAYVAARRAYSTNREAELRGAPSQAAPVLAGGPRPAGRPPRRPPLELISARQPMRDPAP